MEIHVLRHGIAEDAGPGRRDADRALTPEGREKLRTVLRRAREGGLRPDVILTSPLLRARQTAEIAKAELGFEGDLTVTDALAPEGEPRAVWSEIRLHAESGSILLAGHNPLFGSLVGYLLGAPALQVDMKKGAIVRVDVGAVGVQPRGVLKHMIVPRLG